MRDAGGAPLLRVNGTASNAVEFSGTCNADRSTTSDGHLLTVTHARATLGLMSIGDDRPRILDDELATMIEEYNVDKGLDEARQRWQETSVAQEAAGIVHPRFLALHPIVSQLRARFAAELKRAQAQFNRTQPATVEALHRARERLQLVSGEHAPLDDDVHAEYQALAPVLESIDLAIAEIMSHEAQLARVGRLPWYRRRVGGRGYTKKTAGAGTSGHPKWEWVPGHEDTAMATRADEIWFTRAGADPLVALKIAQAVMKAVQPPAVKKRRGQFEDEQINRVLKLMKHAEVNLTTSEISQLLVAIGYEPKKVSIPNLNRRAAARRDKGHRQPVAKTKNGRTLGRPRTKRIQRSTAVAPARIS